MTELSVILPCYNGAETLRRNLPGFIEYLEEKGLSYELIVVDDGSLDPTATEKVAARYRCKFVSNQKNMGKGAAVRRGMLEAQGEYRIYTDVDIPFHLDAFDEFLRYLDFKEFDVVVGDRTLPDSSYFLEIAGIRKFGSSVFSFIVGRFVAGGMFDTQCGMKGFRAAAAVDLFSHSRINGFAFDVELLYISLKRNYDIKRLPVRLRCNETSSVNVVLHGLRMLFDLLRIKCNHALGRYRKSPLSSAQHSE